MSLVCPDCKLTAEGMATIIEEHGVYICIMCGRELPQVLATDSVSGTASSPRCPGTVDWHYGMGRPRYSSYNPSSYVMEIMDVLGDTNIPDGMSAETYWDVFIKALHCSVEHSGKAVTPRLISVVLRELGIKQRPRILLNSIYRKYHGIPATEVPYHVRMSIIAWFTKFNDFDFDTIGFGGTKMRPSYLTYMLLRVHNIDIDPLLLGVRYSSKYVELTRRLFRVFDLKMPEIPDNVDWSKPPETPIDLWKSPSELSVSELVRDAVTRGKLPLGRPHLLRSAKKVPSRLAPGRAS